MYAVKKLKKTNTGKGGSPSIVTDNTAISRRVSKGTGLFPLNLKNTFD
jgi:hypothetical protein